MKQPKIINIIGNKQDRLLRRLTKVNNINCILQERSEKDDSKIVYISNPFYKKNTKEIDTAAPFIALTDKDYEVVEWEK